MRFIVTGSVESTGRDTQITIEAADPHEAESKALLQGLLVSTVIPDPAVVPDVLPYRSPRAVLPDPAPLVSDGPPYKGILTAAAWVSGFGMVAIVIGAVSLVAGAGAMMHGGEQAAWGWGSAVVGFWLVLAGFLLRLLAASAEALRDLARNSFRR